MRINKTDCKDQASKNNSAKKDDWVPLKLCLAIIAGHIVTFFMVIIVIKPTPSEYPVFIGFWVFAIILTPILVWNMFAN